MVKMRREQKLWDYDSEKGIVDYNKRDFREFWEGRAMAMVHAEEQTIIRKLLPSTGGWFLDLGCGFGRLLPDYDAPDRNLVLVDYALNHLEMADQLYSGNNIHLVAADAMALPFREGVFDNGVCVRFFHHVSEPDSLFAELSRVFRPAGSLLFSYVNKRNLLRVLLHGRKTLAQDHREIDHQVFACHPRYFDNLVKRFGFQVETLKGTGLLYQITHNNTFLKGICMENSPLAARFMDFFCQTIDNGLNPFRLCQMQFALLKRAEKNSGTGIPPTKQLRDILLCPKCRSLELIEEPECFICGACLCRYPRKGRIVDFR